MEFRVTVTALPLTIYYYKVSRVSQVVLEVKNPPAHAGDIETQVRLLGQADPLEKEMATHSNSCLENPMDRGAWRVTVHGVAKSRTRLSDFTFTFKIGRAHV